MRIRTAGVVAAFALALVAAGCGSPAPCGSDGSVLLPGDGPTLQIWYLQ